MLSTSIKPCQTNSRAEEYLRSDESALLKLTPRGNNIEMGFTGKGSRNGFRMIVHVQSWNSI